MRKFLLIIAVLVSVSANAQQDTSKLTVKNVYEDVKAGFSKLVSPLEGPSKHVYEIYVRQQHASAVANLISTIFFFVLLFLIGLMAINKAQKTDDSDMESFMVGTAIVSWIAAAVAVIVMIIYLPDWITKLSNPEYYAIKEVIDSLSKIR